MLLANDYRYRLHGPSRESNRAAKKSGNREVAAVIATPIAVFFVRFLDLGQAVVLQRRAHLQRVVVERGVVAGRQEDSHAEIADAKRTADAGALT